MRFINSYTQLTLIAIYFYLYYPKFCRFVIIIKYNLPQYLFHAIRYSCYVILHFYHLRCFETIFRKPYGYFSFALKGVYPCLIAVLRHCLIQCLPLKMLLDQEISLSASNLPTHRFCSFPSFPTRGSGCAMLSLRWLTRVFTNNPSYLAYVTEQNLVTLSLRFCSRDSQLRLPI